MNNIINTLIKKNILLRKLTSKFSDRIFLSEKSDVILKRKNNKLINEYKYIKKEFFKDLKYNFEVKYNLGDNFLEIFKNPYLLDFVKEEDDYYIFKKKEGFVYDKIAPSIEQNTIIYLNNKICKYFQEQFNTNLFLFGETHKIDDLVFTNDNIYLHDVKKLVIFEENVFEDLFCKK